MTSHDLPLCNTSHQPDNFHLSYHFMEPILSIHHRLFIVAYICEKPTYYEST